MNSNDKELTSAIEPNTRTVVLYGELGDGPQTEVTIFDETMWMTQRQMADVFGTTVANINVHLGNIYKEGELDKAATIKEFLIVRQEAGRQVKRKFMYYNLNAIVSVGYRVNSSQATRFRIWATKVLKEYIIKGFALDDERLKQGKKPSDRTISASFSKEYVQFGPVKLRYGVKSQTSSLPVALITTRVPKPPEDFSLVYRIFSILR